MARREPPLPTCAQCQRVTPWGTRSFRDLHASGWLMVAEIGCRPECIEYYCSRDCLTDAVYGVRADVSRERVEAALKAR